MFEIEDGFTEEDKLWTNSGAQRNERRTSAECAKAVLDRIFEEDAETCRIHLAYGRSHCLYSLIPQSHFHHSSWRHHQCLFGHCWEAETVFFAHWWCVFALCMVYFVWITSCINLRSVAHCDQERNSTMTEVLYAIPCIAYRTSIFLLHLWMNSLNDVELHT